MCIIDRGTPGAITYLGAVTALLHQPLFPSAMAAVSEVVIVPPPMAICPARASLVPELRSVEVIPARRGHLHPRSFAPVISRRRAARRPPRRECTNDRCSAS
ncbi:hypothetical protein GQ55_1G253400 [Panicum hallii var. hallii]|uniref:Uncharacterized protein n=1 Tax=Panicum hallii var. hallii TaxID=1504633 RepID=A0A2T7F7D2_9POAL|nr:hypothetical protein GQ55_1G253400 [Panicum hallii var. hallii]